MEMNKYIEHTLLKQDATKVELVKLFDEAKEYNFLGVCVNPVNVKLAAEYLKGSDIKIVTVVGFPLGQSTTESKVLETIDAIKNGADEIDMVINIGMLREKRFDDVLEEIKAIKKSCGGKLLKVIIETCLLTEDEKVKMCEIVSASGADYIKTSTGFSTGGATPEDIKLFAENVAPHLKIKAAGGISSIEDAENFISLGADRLGTSRIVKIVKNEECGNVY